MQCIASNALRYVISRRVNLAHRQQLSRVVRTMVSKSKTTPAEPTSVETHKVVVDGEQYTEVKEGLGRILTPFTAKKGSSGEGEVQTVFYNPIQQFNRDLTVLAIKVHGEEVVARRKAASESKINKKKRKRDDTEDGRPQKQPEAPLAQSETNAPQSTAVDTRPEQTDADPMEVSHSPRNQQGDNSNQSDELGAPANGNGKDVVPKDETGTGDQSKPERKLLPPRFTILDALSATGLRALRYAQELPFVTSVTANDLTPTAVEAIKRNAKHNGVEDRIRVNQGDARAHMYSLVAQEVTDEHENNPRGYKKGPNAPTGKYDVIDLDPYGTAATFFDSAIHAVRDDGGLLCVTCTDSGVWASHGYPEKAYALYGGVPLKGFYSHEVGLRLVLHGLAATAARSGLAIEPLLSLSIDYYLRVFVRVKKSPANVKFLAGKTMIVYSCDQGCGAWETQLLVRNKKAPNAKGSGFFYKHGLSQAPTTDHACKHCGTKTHLAGPMYGGPLHSPDFINRILAELPNAPKDIYGTIPRIEGMLHTALEESAIPPPQDAQPACKDDELAALEPYPFFFHPTSLAGAIHCTCPDEESFRGALRGLGYEVTRSHCKPGSIKTNAPWSVIWHIMREWTRQKAPVKKENIKKGTAAYRLLRLDREDEDGEDKSQETKTDEVDKLEVVFNQALGRDKSRKGLVRYQMNPKENWGPLTRAKGH